jgi:hypothetical protein
VLLVTLTKFASITLLGKTNLVMLVTNGVPGATNYLLSSTTLALPKINWARLATNIFDAGGNLALTNAVNPGNAQRFFQISMLP